MSLTDHLGLSGDSLQRLREVAEAADADGRKWYWRGGYPQSIIRQGDVVLVAQTLSDPDHRPNFAEFIAAFDPPTVLALLDGYRKRHTLTQEDWDA